LGRLARPCFAVVLHEDRVEFSDDHVAAVDDPVVVLKTHAGAIGSAYDGFKYSISAPKRICFSYLKPPSVPD
jgi:hypothetical protein